MQTHHHTSMQVLAMISRVIVALPFKYPALTACSKEICCMANPVAGVVILSGKSRLLFSNEPASSNGPDVPLPEYT